MDNLVGNGSCRWLPWRLWACLTMVVACGGGRVVHSATPVAATTPTQLEQDWLRQVPLRYGTDGPPAAQIAPAEDAAGGCDGLIDGKWGFHTLQEKDPWWQVDLGRVVTLDRLLVYNRCDGGFAHRAAHLQVRLSEDGDHFSLGYQHDGTPFRGHADQQPLCIRLSGCQARFVRLQLPGTVYFHLDEVQVYAERGEENIALHRPATQSSVSQWSARSPTGVWGVDWPAVVRQSIERGERLAAALARMGVAVQPHAERLEQLRRHAGRPAHSQPETEWQRVYFQVRQVTRELAMTNPLLDFDGLLFVKRAPTMFPHLSDQYYGWWARPGGGLFLLEGLTSAQPQIRCLTSDWPAGNFLRPDISYDGRRVLFAFSRYDASVADERNKRNKDNVPEQVFYHLFEMDLCTGETRPLTQGKYDDFDGRYLPSGDILFLSTRKGQFLQCTAANAQRTLNETLPDSYVRCGGDDYRPVPVFTMHCLSADAARIWPVSAFETFEYTPCVTHDGRVLYCRWDYIDRFNGHFFSLWSTNPDGTNAQLVYGNYTKAPQATLEPRSIPGSSKILFTAAAHHSITGGSIVLLDQAAGNEGDGPIERVTPEVPFPETERNVGSFYANPWPLSEDFYLVSWSHRPLPPHGRIEDDRNPVNAQGIYLADRYGNLDLLHSDPDISSMTPIPVRSRPRPPAYSSPVCWSGEQVGSVFVQDIYQGLQAVERGTVKRLRIVGVVPKVQPQMNVPSLGVSREETGKFVLGSVPVEADGSAHFQIPSGLPVFFQALDESGLAVQTMRSLTYVQPGQTMSCIGCHESRHSTPADQFALAMRRGPSRIRSGPPGSWPLRYDELVQPVLDERCLECHRANVADARAARLDLSAEKSRATLLDYADGDLAELVFERDMSLPGETPSRHSRLLRFLQGDELHRSLLSAQQLRRLAVWMDTYGQTQGAFSAEQETQLRDLRAQYHYLFDE